MAGVQPGRCDPVHGTEASYVDHAACEPCDGLCAARANIEINQAGTSQVAGKALEFW